MVPQFFPDPESLRAWFAEHAATDGELLLGYWKNGTGRPSVTWPESVDEAPCVGWIDGIRRRIDDDSYSVRFTPRRAASTWNEVNLRRVAELTVDVGPHQPSRPLEFDLLEPAGPLAPVGQTSPASLSTRRCCDYRRLAHRQAFSTRSPSYRIAGRSRRRAPSTRPAGGVAHEVPEQRGFISHRLTLVAANGLAVPFRRWSPPRL